MTMHQFFLSNRLLTYSHEHYWSQVTHLRLIRAFDVKQLSSLYPGNSRRRLQRWQTARQHQHQHQHTVSKTAKQALTSSSIDPPEQGPNRVQPLSLSTSAQGVKSNLKTVFASDLNYRLSKLLQKFSLSVHHSHSH